MASDEPLNATCTGLMPAASLNRSPFMCVELPCPPELKRILPGLARASSMKSFSVLTPSVGVTTSMLLEKPSWVTPAKSLSGS